MTVAKDVLSTGGASFTHTPVGTVACVSALVVMSNAGDVVTGISYGALALTETTNSPLIAGGSEGGSCYSYASQPGDTIPSGPQTVTVSVSAGTPRTQVQTVTGAGPCEVFVTNVINDTEGAGGSGTRSATLSLGGRVGVVHEVIWSETGGVIDITPLTNWTSNQETDEGSETNARYSYDLVASTDVTFGCVSGTVADIAVLAVAIGEVEAGDAVDGATAQVLPKLGQALVGKEAISGATAQTLSKLAQAISGEVTAEGVAGSVAQTLPRLGQSAAGDVVAPAVTGTVAQTLARLVQSAAGTVTMAVEGVVVQVLPSLAQQIIGVVRNPFTPSADQPITYGGGGHDDLELRVRAWWDRIDALRKENAERESAERERRAEIERKTKEFQAVQAEKVKARRRSERESAEQAKAQELQSIRADIAQSESQIDLLQKAIRRTEQEITRVLAEMADAERATRRRRAAMFLMMVASQ